jgi:hypothetical protein
MERHILQDPSKPIKRVFDEVVVRADDDDDDIPEFHTLRTRLNRTRSFLLPEIPHTVEDVVIEGEWAETWNRKRFMSLQDNDWGLLVFATDANYKKLKQCSTIYIDGTFRTCPVPYMQFVTIHGSYNGRVLPFVMALLNGKQVGQYRQLLQHVKEKVREVTGHRFRPTRVVCDFEQSIIIATETELVGIRICGCYFHFCQSLWRRVQEVGLARAYRQRQNLRKCLRKFMAIGFLPMALVRQNFRLLATSRRTARLIRRYPALQDFINYMERNYLYGNFPPTMWNVFDRDGDTRTNNYVEGCMSMLIVIFKTILHCNIVTC